MSNPIQKAIDLVGGRQEDLAKKCRVKQQTISKWLRKGCVPPERVEDVVQAVNGQLTAFELCPLIGKLLRLSSPKNKTNSNN